MNTWIEAAAAVCAASFIVVLAVSAYWDPSIRVLHVFEAVPYAAAGVLCLRQNKLGYALGFAGGAFWLWLAAFHTGFVRSGFESLGLLLRTGVVSRPDQLIAAPAAIATGGLALFAVLGYVRLSSKGWPDVIPWATAVAVVPAFFVGIFALFAPQYLAIIERAF